MLRMLQLQYACIPKAEKRYFCSVKCDISDAWIFSGYTEQYFFVLTS